MLDRIDRANKWIKIRGVKNSDRILRAFSVKHREYNARYKLRLTKKLKLQIQHDFGFKDLSKQDISQIYNISMRKVNYILYFRSKTDRHKKRKKYVMTKVRKKHKQRKKSAKSIRYSDRRVILMKAEKQRGSVSLDASTFNKLNLMLLKENERNSKYRNRSIVIREALRNTFPLYFQ